MRPAAESALRKRRGWLRITGAGALKPAEPVVKTRSHDVIALAQPVVIEVVKEEAVLVIGATNVSV
jgi:hypothetical protein